MADGLAALGLRPAVDRADAVGLLDEMGFAYLSLTALCPELDRLLRLRRLLGLRSPLNTAARLLNPFDARAGVDGVFHPGYIALHLGAAERLGRERLVVVKGGGGEAERSAVKAVAAHWYDRALGGGEIGLVPPGVPEEMGGGEPGLAEVWRGAGGTGAATAVATIGLGLLALGVGMDGLEAEAARIWDGRLGAPALVRAPVAASGG